MAQALYDRDMVRFMWEELEAVGVSPLTTVDEVDKAISSTEGVTLVVTNSVCGCAAGNARPGIAIALQNKVIPDTLTTVFAGVDMDAVARARELMPEIQPTSPSVALFKDGQPIFNLPRHEIEGSTAEEVASKLVAAFNAHCTKAGPSVPREKVVELFASGPDPRCGSDFKV